MSRRISVLRRRAYARVNAWRRKFRAGVVGRWRRIMAAGRRRISIARRRMANRARWYARRIAHARGAVKAKIRR